MYMCIIIISVLIHRMNIEQHLKKEQKLNHLNHSSFLSLYKGEN